MNRLILASGLALWVLVILVTAPLLVPAIFCCLMFPPAVPVVEKSIRAVHGVPFRICMRGAMGIDLARAASALDVVAK
jgi:hypothetical protein